MSLIDRARTSGWPATRTVVLVSITGATVVRMVYGMWVNDPLGGADADTYHAAGRVMAEEGPFAPDIPGVPYWPAGYPAMVAAAYALGGASPRAVVPVQVLLLAVGTYFAYRLAAMHLGERVGLITALLLSASPALLAAPTVLMYETTLGVAMIAGLLGISRSSTTERPLPTAVGTGLALAAAAALQPKALLPAMLAAAWLALTSHRHLVAALVAVLVLLGPAALAARSWIAEGEPIVAATLGVTMHIGLNDAADGGYQPKTAPVSGLSDDLAQRDRELLRESLRWTAENPGRAVALTGPKAWNFWSPLAGSEGSRGTWFHAFDPRRALPSSAEGWQSTWTVLRAGWTMMTIGFVVFGAVLGWRRAPAGTALLAVPVVTFLAISVVSIGDPRFRIPVAPFYTAFIAVALVTLFEHFHPGIERG